MFCHHCRTYLIFWIVSHRCSFSEWVSKGEADIEKFSMVQVQCKSYLSITLSYGIDCIQDTTNYEHLSDLVMIHTYIPAVLHIQIVLIELWKKCWLLFLILSCALFSTVAAIFFFKYGCYRIILNHLNVILLVFPIQLWRFWGIFIFFFVNLCLLCPEYITF